MFILRTYKVFPDEVHMSSNFRKKGHKMSLPRPKGHKMGHTVRPKPLGHVYCQTSKDIGPQKNIPLDPLNETTPTFWRVLRFRVLNLKPQM